MPVPVRSYLRAQAGGQGGAWNPGLDLHTESGRLGQNAEPSETWSSAPNPRVCPGMPLWNAPLPPISPLLAIHTLKLTDVCVCVGGVQEHKTLFPHILVPTFYDRDCGVKRLGFPGCTLARPGMEGRYSTSEAGFLNGSGRHLGVGVGIQKPRCQK